MGNCTKQFEAPFAELAQRTDESFSDIRRRLDNLDRQIFNTAAALAELKELRKPGAAAGDIRHRSREHSYKEAGISPHAHAADRQSSLPGVPTTAEAEAEIEAQG